MKWLDKLMGKAPKTIADLEKALAEAQRLQQEAERGVAALSARRAAALLDADDSVVDGIEAELQRMYRQGDRSGIAIGELERRIAETKAADIEAQERAEIKAAEKAGAKALELTKNSYLKQARALAELLVEIRDLDATVERTNARMRDGTFKVLTGEPAVKTGAQRLPVANDLLGPAGPFYHDVVLPMPGTRGGIFDGQPQIWQGNAAGHEGADRG